MLVEYVGDWTEVKAMVFPVVMYGCESWKVKKAEHRRIDAFELWCWRRLLRVPWTAKRSNQSILKEISPEYSLGVLMLKLKPQYFGHLMQRTDSFENPWCWERLKVGGEGNDRGLDGWMALPTWWTWVWVNYGSSWWTGKSGMLQSMGSQRVGHDCVTELNWTASCPGTQVPTCSHAPSPLWFWPAGLWLGSVPDSVRFLLKGGDQHMPAAPTSLTVCQF